VDTGVHKEVDLFTWERTNRVEELRLAAQRSPHYQTSKVSR
jgi:hypothetical protein